MPTITSEVRTEGRRQKAEDRRQEAGVRSQKTEIRMLTANAKPRTPNPEPRTPGAGGRPLRRRREMVLVYGRPRLRGTAALQASIDHRCDERMAIIGRFPGGRPLRRRREMVLIYDRPRLRGTAPSPRLH